MENPIESKRFSINGSTLKLIAIISMFIDHIGAAVYEKLLWHSRYFDHRDSFLGLDGQGLYYLDRVHRYIGRIAFPIFCFLLVEGFYHTKNRGRYALRLGVFALISEIPFDLAFDGQILEYSYQNVFFTLFCGLMGIWLFEEIGDRLTDKGGLALLKILALPLMMFVADFLRTDYGWFGVGFIYIMYFCRGKNALRNIFGSLACAWEITAPLAFIPIQLYNGKRGWRAKYVFYLFYPVHLLFLYGVYRWIVSIQ